MNIGKILSEARQEKSLTIAEVVKAIKIRAVYIQALEANSFSELPGGIYTEGYLRLYAEYLGLDSPKILDEFKKQNTSAIPVEEVNEKNINESVNYSDTTPSKLLLIFCLILIIALVVIRNYNDHKKANQTDNEQTTLSDRLNEIISNDKKTITILANQKTLVTIFDSEKISALDGNAEIIFSSVMNIGDNYSFTSNNNSSPLVQTEDIGKLDVFIDGYLVSSLDDLEINDKGVVLDINKLLSKIEID